MKIAIYSPVRNESKIIEWINYNTKIGIDFFILFDDESDISLNDILLQNNINKDIFKIIYNTELSHINLAKNNYYNSEEIFTNLILPELINNNIDYLLRIDTDEFLYLNKFQNIKELIFFYSPFDNLKINWLLFGSNNLIKNISNTSVINIFNKCDNKLNEYVKCLTKVSNIKNFNGFAHYVNLIENSITKNILNNITVNSLTEIINNDINNSIYIAHYCCQDLYTFVYRKFYYNSYYSKTRITMVIDNNNIDNFVEYIYLCINNVKNDNFLKLQNMFISNTRDIKWILYYLSLININKIINNNLIHYINE